MKLFAMCSCSMLWMSDGAGRVLQGRYIFKLLAVDVPTADGPEQRVYLAGDEAVYNRGSL